MTRQEVIKKYNEITLKHGIPTEGKVFCQEQLVSEIVSVLSVYAECYIQYEFGKWDISAAICIKSAYGADKENAGKVRAAEWFSEEQLKALHELAFGYQF